MHRPLSALAVGTLLVGVAAVTGPPSSATTTAATPTAAPAVEAVSLPALPEIERPPATLAASSPAPDRARSVPLPVRELTRRLRPDVLVLGARTISASGQQKLKALSPEGGSVTFRAGTITVAGKSTGALGIDPSTFRTFAAKGTAEATEVWQAIARGEVVASHAKAAELSLQLGKDVPVTPRAGGEPVLLRLGALATTGIPSTDLVVDSDIGRQLGLPDATGMLLTAGEGSDPIVLADKVRTITGKGATVDLLTPPAANPVAFLTGNKAAKAFGAFSYRYFPDGTIAPDSRWVRENIVTATVPIMGTVTCHRLMVPQLRGALQEVVARGLGDTLHRFDGCYVPRFIERNPANSISLHTWGIAIDMDASTNYRGIAGTMDPEVVNIFKRWGFRWGGDWSYTDPMHFELAALLTSPKR